MNNGKSGKVSASAKIVIRKKAAKPLTPDELANKRKVATEAKISKSDLSKLRSGNGSIEPIALFKAIWGLKAEHFPAIIQMLNNEEQIRQHTRYKIMQPVYVVIDGTGAYVNDYCLGYVIDADKEFLKCINAEGTLIATFPINSSSVYTRKEYKALEPSLKPASEKPAPKTKIPLIGNSDFEPPTINDAVGAKRISKNKLRKSNLYDLFATFNSGSTLVERDEDEVKKKKKKKATEEPTVEAPSKKKKKSKIKDKVKSKKQKAKTKKLDYSHLSGLDFTGYETEPGESEPLIVLQQREGVEGVESDIAEVETTTRKKKKFNVKLKKKTDSVEVKTKKKKKVSRVNVVATMAATPTTKASTADKVKEAQAEEISQRESLTATRNLSMLIGKLKGARA